MEFVIRLKGQQEKIVDLFVKEGFYSNKSEVIRAGILELYYKYFDVISEHEKEIMLKVAEKIDSEGEESYSEEEFLAKHPELK